MEADHGIALVLQEVLLFDVGVLLLGMIVVGAVDENGGHFPGVEEIGTHAAVFNELLGLVGQLQLQSFQVFQPLALQVGFAQVAKLLQLHFAREGVGRGFQ